MAAQIRPTRLEVTDRFPMLGFTIRTDSRRASPKMVIATDPELFTQQEKRTASRTSTPAASTACCRSRRARRSMSCRPTCWRASSPADRLYFGLATATPPAAARLAGRAASPTAQSPYVSLTGLSDRALRRVRMFPPRNGAGSYGGQGASAVLQWAGDRAQPGTTPPRPRATAPRPPRPATAPSVAACRDDRARAGRRAVR